MEASKNGTLGVMVTMAAQMKKPPSKSLGGHGLRFRQCGFCWLLLLCRNVKATTRNAPWDSSTTTHTCCRLPGGRSFVKESTRPGSGNGYSMPKCWRSALRGAELEMPTERNDFCQLRSDSIVTVTSCKSCSHCATETQPLPRMASAYRRRIRCFSGPKTHVSSGCRRDVMCVGTKTTQKCNRLHALKTLLSSERGSNPIR